MFIVSKILYVLFVIFVALLSLLFMYFILRTFILLFGGNRLHGQHKFKEHLDHSKELIKNHRYIKIVDFIKWVIIDIVRGKDKLRLWGIWAFCGYYGEGKTMGCVQFAKHLQKTISS